ncbi:MAG: hypothetical protein K8R92_03530 [Planctomycetes bacterium]|nr:hypothetical protein [Planctomycetota bacterium]
MNLRHRPFAALVLASIAALLSACTTGQKNVYDTTWDGWQSHFIVDANSWTSRGSNDYFILEPGYTLEYADKSGNARLTITVTQETRVIDGVETRVVVESETVDGKPKEISRNFFAMCKSTKDIFYFGEEVDIYKDGAISSHEGGWKSGEQGATFGLFMPGKIDVGARFYQEHAPGVAMDRYVIRSKDKTLDTPAGHFDRCVQMEETTPLEPNTKEFKLHAPGVGLLQDGDLLLVKQGKTAQNSAIAVPGTKG